MFFGILSGKKKTNDNNKQANNSDSNRYYHYENASSPITSKNSFNTPENTLEQNHQREPHSTEEKSSDNKAYTIPAEDNCYSYYTTNTQQTESKTARLMALIGEAIQKWAEEYHMESMPKSIVFGQALDAMRAMEPMFKNNQTEHKR